MTSGLSHTASKRQGQDLTPVLTLFDHDGGHRDIEEMAPGPHSSPNAFSLTSCCQISAVNVSKNLRISQRASRIMKSPNWLCDLGQMPSALWSQFAKRHNGRVEPEDAGGGGGGGGLSSPGTALVHSAGRHDSKHLESPTPPPAPSQGQMAGGRSGHGEQGSLLHPAGASFFSIPASVLLYLMVATVSRKEERGGKVNFPPPTQIFLAGVVFMLPSQEGGVGRSAPIQVSLPRREDSQHSPGSWAGPMWA